MYNENMWYFCAPIVLVFSHPWHPNSQPVNFASLTVLLGQLLQRIVLALNFLNDQCDLWKQIQSYEFQKGLNLEAEILRCHSAFVPLNKISQALSPLLASSSSSVKWFLHLFRHCHSASGIIWMCYHKPQNLLLGSKQEQNSVGTFIFSTPVICACNTSACLHDFSERTNIGQHKACDMTITGIPPPQVLARLEVLFYCFHEKILFLVGANGLV